MYWNISLDQTTKSTWGWSQNSLVTVDTATKSFRYNHDYYLMKHLTHYVDKGARSVEASGSCDDALGFINPDGTIVLLIRNELSRPQLLQVEVKGSSHCPRTTGGLIGNTDNQACLIPGGISGSRRRSALSDNRMYSSLHRREYRLRWCRTYHRLQRHPEAGLEPAQNEWRRAYCRYRA